MIRFLAIIFLFFSLIACKKDEQPMPGPTPNPQETYYFPPLTGATWETKSANSLGWDTTKLNEAFDYAGTVNTFGLIVLQNGRIVKEKYWNNWNQDTRYYIASAGKSVLAFLMGMAQEEGLLSINDKTSQYLGTGWTSLPLNKENLITLRHQLTMTTGLDDDVPDDNCEAPSCLVYKSDAGTRWAYHNAPYTLLHDVLANAAGQPINQYSDTRLFNRIGMPQATWFNNVLYCTTREAARYGSLSLRKGIWQNDTLLHDRNYFNAMTSTSQNINLSYGYLWWLNGKATSMVPTLQTVFIQPLVPNGPSDMIMALGKDDKKIYVVPSLNMVVVRLGDAAGPSSLAPSGFDNTFWGKMKLAVRY
ncbi:MAG: serine hydrolase domain-containing protein [Ferruginibacter sp.]